MKVSDIVVGGVYSNGKKGRFYSERKVLGMWHGEAIHPYYDHLKDTFILRYEVVKGQPCRWVDPVMTVARFANWAKERVR